MGTAHYKMSDSKGNVIPDKSNKNGCKNRQAGEAENCKCHYSAQTSPLEKTPLHCLHCMDNASPSLCSLRLHPHSFLLCSRARNASGIAPKTIWPISREQTTISLFCLPRISFVERSWRLLGVFFAMVKKKQAKYGSNLMEDSINI